MKTLKSINFGGYGFDLVKETKIEAVVHVMDAGVVSKVVTYDPRQYFGFDDYMSAVWGV